jgi:hypothetical protein
MDVVAASEETLRWAREDPNPDQSGRQVWHSIREDFHLACRLVGDHLKSKIDPLLKETRASLNSFPTDDSKAQSRSLRALEQLQALWDSPEVQAAAWADLVACCRSTKCSRDRLAMQRDIFWRMIQSSERGAEALSGQLNWILSGEFSAVSGALIELGDIDAAHNVQSSKDPQTEANKLDHIDLCKRIIEQSPRRAQNVFWLAFRRARISVNILEIGSVTLLDSQWMRSVLDHGGRYYDQLPRELLDSRNVEILDTRIFPGKSDWVFARVDLGVDAISGSRTRAVKIAQAAILPAQFKSGRRFNWRLLDGGVRFMDGEIAGWQEFHSINEEDYRNWTDDDTGSKLAVMQSAISRALSTKHQEMSKIASLIGDFLKCAELSPERAVPIAVSIIEKGRRSVGIDDWSGYLDVFWKSAWIRHQMIDQLSETLRHSTNIRQLPGGPTSEHSSRVARLRSTITTSQNATYRVNFGEGLNAISELVIIHPPHTDVGRLVRTTARRYASSGALRAWRDELSADWKRSNDRLLRVRNAIVHAGPVTEYSAVSALSFASDLACQAIDLKLETILNQKNDSEAHDSHKIGMNSWIASLDSITNPSELFE